MSLDDARREARCIYVCVAPGQLISSLVWFLSAALGTWVSWRAAMWALVAGGIFIFVALEAFIRLIGRRPSLSPGNPLNPLVMQIAFTLPFMLPLIVAAFRGQPDWLYPAFLVALGAHFLPFMFFFGLWISASSPCCWQAAASSSASSRQRRGRSPDGWGRCCRRS